MEQSLESKASRERYLSNIHFHFIYTSGEKTTSHTLTAPASFTVGPSKPAAVRSRPAIKTPAFCILCWYLWDPLRTQNSRGCCPIACWGSGTVPLLGKDWVPVGFTLSQALPGRQSSCPCWFWTPQICLRFSVCSLQA